MSDIRYGSTETPNGVIIENVDKLPKGSTFRFCSANGELGIIIIGRREMHIRSVDSEKSISDTKVLKNVKHVVECSEFIY